MIFLSFLVLLVIREASGVIYRLNGTEYRKLPPLYLVDEFYPCLQAPGDVYCSVDAVLVANTTSELLNTIHEYSAHTTTHFNHTVVRRGLCVTATCRQYLSSSTDLNGTLEACLNATLYKSHRLQVNLIKDKVRCTYYNEKLDTDAGDWALAAVLALLLALAAGGSAWDGRLSGSRHIGARVLLCFSVKRNWRRLTQPASEGAEPRLQRLKCFTGFKALTMMCVIFGHTPIISYIITNNPEFVEESYHNPMFSLVYGGTLIVQNFFLISGCLLAYNILIMEERMRIGWRMLPKGIVLRWLRLTPPFAMMLAFICTWLRHLGNGPFWKTNVGVEIEACRRDWYYFLFYAHNYVDKSQCMAHTWYVAADMQLSALGLALLALTPGARARQLAVGAALAAGLLAPPAHTYLQHLHAIFIASPEIIYNYFVEDPTFNNLYKRGHTNLVCYAMGLALGMLIYYLQNINIDVAKYKKYRPLYWATIPVGILLALTASMFYIDGIQIPMAFQIFYSGAIRAVYGVLYAVLLLGTVFKLDKVYRAIAEWRGWAAPGRLAYCAYLVHVPILRTYLASHTSLIHSSAYGILMNYIAILMFSFAAAVPLWMVVEAPCAQLVKICFMPDSKGSNLEKIKSVSMDTQVVVLGSEETINIKL